MKTEDRYYRVSPRILPADAEAQITIEPRHAHCRFAGRAPYTVSHYLMEGSPAASKAALADGMPIDEVYRVFGVL